MGVFGLRGGRVEGSGMWGWQNPKSFFWGILDLGIWGLGFRDQRCGAEGFGFRDSGDLGFRA